MIDKEIIRKAILHGLIDISHEIDESRAIFYRDTASNENTLRQLVDSIEARVVSALGANDG